MTEVNYVECITEIMGALFEVVGDRVQLEEVGPWRHALGAGSCPDSLHFCLYFLTTCCTVTALPLPSHGGELTPLKLHAKVILCPFKLSVSYFVMVVRTENTICQYQEGQGLITRDDRSHLPEGRHGGS